MGIKLLHYAAVLFIIPAVCVAGINGVFSLAAENIEKQQLEAKMAGVRAAFGYKPSDKSVKFKTEEMVDRKGIKWEVFVHESGYAIESSAQGYESVIRLITAVDRNFEKVIGISVISQAETPGFGAKIDEPPVTMTLFGGKVKDADEKFIPPFQEGYYGIEMEKLDMYTKVKELAADSTVDAISGATITSDAVMKAVKLGADKLREVVQNNGEGNEQ